MTNIVTVSNGTFFTTESLQTIIGQITRGLQWIELRPSGSLLNLAHVVSIEPDGTEATDEQISVIQQSAVEQAIASAVPRCICMPGQLEHRAACPFYTGPRDAPIATDPNPEPPMELRADWPW